MEPVDPSVELQQLKKELEQLRPQSNKKDSFSATNAYLFGIFFTLGAITVSVLLSILGFLFFGIIGRSFYDYLIEQSNTSATQPTQTIRSSPNTYRR